MDGPGGGHGRGGGRARGGHCSGGHGARRGGQGEARNERQSRHQTRAILAPIISRFFKILYDGGTESYSEHLELPPYFVAQLGHLLGKETYLEDVNGTQWTVGLSNVNGSLAFSQGWSEFYLSHGLEPGLLLEFRYIVGSHFLVRIHGTSLVEKTDSSSNNIAPPTTDEQIVAQDERHQSVAAESIDVPNSSHGTPVEHVENASLNAISRGHDIETDRDDEDETTGTVLEKRSSPEIKHDESSSSAVAAKDVTHK